MTGIGDAVRGEKRWLRISSSKRSSGAVEDGAGWVMGLEAGVERWRRKLLRGRRCRALLSILRISRAFGGDLLFHRLDVMKRGSEGEVKAVRAGKGGELWIFKEGPSVQQRSTASRASWRGLGREQKFGAQKVKINASFSFSGSNSLTC